MTAAARTDRRAALAALGVLTAAHLLRHRRSAATTTAVSLTAAAALAALGRRAGHSWTELGFGRPALRRGARHGAAAAGVVAAGYTAGVLLPATRPLFADARAERTVPGLLRQALIEVPLGTVVLEETAFRAVLPALLRGGYGERAARTVPVALFGLWHVLPSAALAEANPAVAAGRASAAAVSVGATTAGGAVFAALRRRSGSVLAPALLHTALNSLGFAAAWAVNRRAAAPRRA